MVVHEKSEDEGESSNSLSDSGASSVYSENQEEETKEKDPLDKALTELDLEHAKRKGSERKRHQSVLVASGKESKKWLMEYSGFNM